MLHSLPVTVKNPEVNHNKRNYGLDLAKAVSIMLVMIWHLQPITLYPTKHANVLSRFLIEATEIFYLQITLVAVPTFILVSLFLFFEKLNTEGAVYFRRRMLRITELYVFWTIIQFGAYYLIRIIERLQTGRVFSLGIPDTTPGYLLVNGGPPLPLVGGSVFYFLFALLLLTAAAYPFFILSKKTNIASVLGIIIILVSLIWIEITNLRAIKIHYWITWNFIVYLPLAYLIHKNQERLKTSTIIALGVGYLAFSLRDIILREMNAPFSAYGRISIILGATTLFASLIKWQASKTSGVLSLLSGFSLGLFATHKYWQYASFIGLNKIYTTYGLAKLIKLQTIHVNILTLQVAIIATFLTIAGVYIINKSPLARYIK